jgi:hypothetical protein
MKKTLFLLLIVATIAGCSKSKDDTPQSGSIIGSWKLEMTRGDPGDGSGKWTNYTGTSVTIQFYEDGTFTDSRNNAYDRYHVDGDMITLSNSTNSNTWKLSVQELNASRLAYYFASGFFCGGPSGEKFVRVNPIVID